MNRLTTPEEERFDRVAKEFYKALNKTLVDMLSQVVVKHQLPVEAATTMIAESAIAVGLNAYGGVLGWDKAQHRRVHKAVFDALRPFMEDEEEDP